MLPVYVSISTFELVNFNAVIFNFLEPAGTTHGTSELERRKDACTTVFMSRQ
jgi:hypothetical protein